jgi:hypothetical protein
MSKKQKPKLIIESSSSSIKKLSSLSNKTISTANKNPCNTENELKEQRTQLNAKLKIQHAECEKTKYETIYRYFNYERNSTYKDLLNALLHYYKDEKGKDNNFILPFESFLDMFEKDTMKYKNFKKQHVFESLCKILLMYDYDDGELGRDKQFYSSLEKFIENPESSSNVKTREQIIDENINVSSEGGVVDIFFKTKHQKNNKNNCEWICDCVSDKIEDNTVTDKQEYILIQNKYYSKEKSDIKNYDVTKIFTKAQSLYKSHITPRIILMVNNSQALNDKLIRSRDANKGIISAIYGVYEIDKWFNLLLYDLLNSENIEDFLKKKGMKDKLKPELGPRFHQMYFSLATIEYHKQGYKKFIWGAVPRSGKSYMIGDLISKRKDSFFNDIIVILGAKTETESQFSKMFSDFSNFNNYGIIKTSTGKKTAVKSNKNIYIFSQEWFKDKLLEDNFKPNVVEDYSDLLKRGNVIDIYFDEVHKGGSTDKSENILNAINNAGVKIDIFVMVTATFAKPNIKYKTNFIDTKEPKILEWSYEDQQVMKYIKNETKMDMMINSRIGIEKDIISYIFQYYKELYQNDFLDVISKQYARHPELVLVQPFDKIKRIEDENFKIEQVFKSNLNCEACFEKQTMQEIRDPSRIFFDYGRVQKLLKLIAGFGSLHPDITVYGYLKTIGAPDHSNKHSEIWFLPDDGLYITPDTCRGVCKPIKSETTHDETKIDNKKNLPNIEPLTRGLAFALMNHSFFREYYNVLIVHNTKIDFKNSENGSKISYESIFKETGISTTIDSKNLSETIRDYETKTFREGKNLIILTGAKLRLGISLPCVDIGFNFDSVQSVDVNYQTMFRVLTERYNKPKPFGYYVDFNKERFINFLYQYNNTYSAGKNISKIKENISSLQGLLLLFNINGLGLKKLDEQRELKLYNSLVNELKLDENGYKSYYSDFNNITEIFKKSLINISINDLHDVKKLIDISNKSSKQKPIKITLKQGEKVKNPVTKVEDDLGEENEGKNENEGVNEDATDNDNSNMLIIKIVSDMLPRIIALIALFSNKGNYDCDNLNNCLDNCLRKIMELGPNCDCSNILQSDILSCYLNSPFYSKNLYSLINAIKNIINKPENEQLFNSTNFIFNNIRETMSKQDKPLIISMSKTEDIQDMIEKYLPVREEKKNKNGEVFTPMKLIEEMLDKLPSNVWTNPELKWLDPANGIGNFPMVAYEKLLEKLPEKYNGPSGSYSDITSKKKYIIEKMLYMVELDPANVKISRRIFGDNANICCSNSELNFSKCIKQFGINEFDIIIGNPPFQDEVKESTGQTKKPRGNKNKLYERITIYFLNNVLKSNGYLLFVTPDNILTGNKNPTYKELIKYDICDININNIKTNYFPGIGQQMCYFLIRKRKTNGYKTTITNNKGISFDVVIEDRGINPVGDWSPNTEKLIDQYMNNNKQNNFIRTSEKNIKNSPDGKIKVLINSTNSIRTNDKNVEGYGVTKFILFRMQPAVEGILDSTGNIGLSTDQIYYLPLEGYNKTDINKIVKFFKSEPYKILQKATTTGQFLKDVFIKSININKIIGKSPKSLIVEESENSSEVDKKEEAGKKIKTLITKKHREKKQQTKKSSKGGKKYTRKHKPSKKTRKTFFSLF